MNEESQLTGVMLEKKIIGKQGFTGSGDPKTH